MAIHTCDRHLAGARNRIEQQPGPSWVQSANGVWTAQPDEANQDEEARPYTVASRNIRGLTLHIDGVLAGGFDVTAFQETEVLECDTTWLKAKARKRLYASFRTAHRNLQRRYR